MLIPRHVGHSRIRTCHIEYPSHQRPSHKYRKHGLPAGDACPQKNNGTNGNGYHTCLTNRTRYQTRHHVPREIGSNGRSLGNAQRSSHGQAIYRLAKTEDRVTRNPYGITGHLRRISKEQESTSDKSHVEHVHTRTTKYFLSKDYRECCGNGQHPQRTIHWHNHRDKDTRNEKTFLDFLFLPLSYNKFNAQTYYIRNDNLRQHGQEAIKEHGPETAFGTSGMEMLIAHIIHAEQQSRYQCNNDHRHDAFTIDGIVNMRSRFRSGVGHEEESLKAVKHRTKRVEFAALFKVRLYLVEIIS
ncbi:unknown [Bacteroides sp. CAG:661]|nr:unknown [Bacteroides sp. CAG:661]